MNLATINQLISPLIDQAEQELLHSGVIPVTHADIDSRSVRKALKAVVKPTVGIYAIWTRKMDSDDWKVRYIGKASNTLNRLSGHFKPDLQGARSRTPAHIKLMEARAEGLQLAVSSIEVGDKNFYSLIESKLIERTDAATSDAMWNKHS